MCIRDSHGVRQLRRVQEAAQREGHEAVRLGLVLVDPEGRRGVHRADLQRRPARRATAAGHRRCLLYTSDAADERSSVDLGGRRIIKKKKNNENSR